MTCPHYPTHPITIDTRTAPYGYDTITCHACGHTWHEPTSVTDPTPPNADAAQLQRALHPDTM